MLGGYSIKEIEKLSGIKAHTIRIWEQRYNMLVPERSVTNIRTYNNADVRFILNVSILNSNGIKISQIAKFTKTEIEQKVLQLLELQFDANTQIDALVISMLDTNEQKFETILNKNIAITDYEQVMLNIIYPFLKRIGIMWQAGAVNPAQEHFITSLIRQKLIANIDKLNFANNTLQYTWVLYLPEGELHELSLLFYYFMLKKRGHKVIYLGQSVPLEDVNKLMAHSMAQNILTVLTYQINEVDIPAYLNKLNELYVSKNIYVSGFQLMNKNIALANNVTFFKDPQDFAELLANF